MKNSVKVERAIKNITQQELAEAVGVSRQTINFIETGRYMPSTIVALKIARHFGKHADLIHGVSCCHSEPFARARKIKRKESRYVNYEPVSLAWTEEKPYAGSKERDKHDQTDHLEIVEKQVILFHKR